MRALELVDTWPVERVGAALVQPAADPSIVTYGSTEPFRLASLTKPMTAWAVMVAVEEGIVELDAPLADTCRPTPDGTTLRHLLSHAAGFPFEGDAVATIERTRTYSNTGIEVAADVVERAAAMPFAEYLAAAVFEPLQMSTARLEGSPAHGGVASVGDMARFVAEMLRPQLLAPASHADVVSVQYPDLAGIVPGVGRFDPCPWGLGVEIHGDKSPHWMADANSSAAFGHFGGAGTMMWADPEHGPGGVGVVALTDRRFDEWADTALSVWPALSDAVIAETST